MIVRIPSRRATWAGGVTLVVVVAVLAVSIFFSLPSNALSARDGGPLRVLSARTLPQSWAFFTKPPNDPEVVPYRVSPEGELKFASRLPNSRRENLFGPTRKQRAQGPEIANLYQEVPEWMDCRSEDGDCLAAVVTRDQPFAVENSSRVPTLCGRLVLVETIPVPWAFRHDYQGWRQEQRAALVEARC